VCPVTTGHTTLQQVSNLFSLSCRDVKELLVNFLPMLGVGGTWSSPQGGLVFLCISREAVGSDKRGGGCFLHSLVFFLSRRRRVGDVPDLRR
jgi:hypothetical protein